MCNRSIIQGISVEDIDLVIFPGVLCNRDGKLIKERKGYCVVMKN